jgi:hypothetical protein
MFVLSRNFPDKLENITPARILRNYRYKAVRESILKYFAGQINKKELTAIREKMTWLEYFRYYLFARSYGIVKENLKLKPLAYVIYKLFRLEDILTYKSRTVIVTPPPDLHPNFHSIFDVVTSFPSLVEE